MTDFLTSGNLAVCPSRTDEGFLMITSHSAFQATLPQLLQVTSGTIATTPTLGLPLFLGVLVPGNLEAK